MLRFRTGQWLVLASIAIFHATAAFGRAGGGGGYSSGGGGSSSSSSSSSFSSGGSGGSGEFTAFDAVVLLVGLAVLVYAGRRARQAAQARALACRRRSLEWAERLREVDGHFDLAAFERRVRGAFLEIQEAWSSQDLSRVRGFMSDGLHERFAIQLREQRALGYRNPMSEVKIVEADLVEARRRPHFDVVAVRFVARAIDVRVDLETGREIEGFRRAERFTEIWSFLRGRDAVRASSDGAGGARGLLEGCCPNCAAPVDPARAWACESCGSALEGAPPDWVLTEITQQGEWRAERRDEDWMKQAVDRDPGLTREQLEDRASVLFWRLMDARRTGSAAELVSCGRTEFVAHETRRLERGSSRYVGDCAVGAVRVRGILVGSEWERALVEVRWSGGVYVRGAQSGRMTVVETGSRRLTRSLLVMSRRAGVKSQVGRCIVSAHCDGCGAPDEGALDGRCGFCGAALNDGRDWLLDRFLELGSSEARLLLAEVGCDPAVPRVPAGSGGASADPSASLPGGTELFAWILAIAYGDGEVDRRELATIDRFARRLGLSSGEARKLQRAAQFSRLEIPEPRDAAEGQRWLQALGTMARADGRLDRREAAVMRRLTERVRAAGEGAAAAGR